MTQKRIGLVGARGHTGRQLLKLIAGHPGLVLDFASSREFAGRAIADIAPEITNGDFVALSPDEIATRDCDAVILALPDGAAAPFVKALDESDSNAAIIDLSADYRFSDDWAYGLPELYREKQKLAGARRIANPGCYATAMQVAIHPLRAMLAAPPSCFGVSGYSGAGTTPSPRNNVERLQDNLMPYALVGHKHEKEVTRHLGKPIYFTPHVHPAFSGLLMTVHLSFSKSLATDELFHVFEAAYKNEKLISVQKEAPDLKQGASQNGVILGGFAVSADGRHGVVVAAEDNLLKGAAVQAIQNLNLALGFDELVGVV